MRPSSGGSRRISKRFLPASALPAISMATPASGTAGGWRRSRGGGGRVCGGGRSVLRRRGQRGLLREVTGRLRRGGLRRRSRPAAAFPRRRGGRWPRLRRARWAAAVCRRRRPPACGLPSFGARTPAWRTISDPRRGWRNRLARFAGSAALALGVRGGNDRGWAAAAACASAAGAACARPVRARLADVATIAAE